jgi:hypothetical protein
VFGIRNLLVLAMGLALALPASAFEVSDVSTEELSDGSIIEYESSFCEVAVGDTVSVTLVGAEGDAATAEIVAASLKAHNAVTPNQGRKKGGARTGFLTVTIGPDGRSADLTLEAVDDGWHTVHVRIGLSTGDELGVNLHSTSCEAEEPTL